MNKKIHLTTNHTRALSSSMTVVEKSLIELEQLMLHHNDTCCNEVLKDVGDDTIENNIKVIREARKYICVLTQKYGTSKLKLSLQRIIDARKTKIWEVLTDTTSKKMNGYGTFPKKYADEFDSDIKELIEITRKINY